MPTANTAFFTSKQVLENGLPILCIIHDEDGDWQFLSGYESSETDGRIIAFSEAKSLIPDYDFTFLPEGMQASRKNINAEWVLSTIAETP